MYQLQVDFEGYGLGDADTEICWILDFVKPEVVLVDKEVAELVSGYVCKGIIVDDDLDGTSGAYEDAVRRGREIDLRKGGKGWKDLVIDEIEENDTMVLNCTSGTTSNPKVHTPIDVTNEVRGNDVSWNLSRCNDKHNRVRSKLSDASRPRSLQIPMDPTHVSLRRMDIPLECDGSRRSPRLSP